MRNMLKKVSQGLLGRLGWKMVRTSVLIDEKKDMDQEFLSVYQRCQPHTMTPIQRMYALYKAVEYVTRYDIPGDIVECGVWKGGSCMLCALELKRRGVMDRQIYLYDTFKGMAAPTAKDVAFEGVDMRHTWSNMQAGEHNTWCYSSLADVKHVITGTGYPMERFTFVEGKVEDTIPHTIPEKIAILRLDTDWYESTKHELIHLFPRLVQNGVLIIDDYGHWKGARAAVDEYFKEQLTPLMLHRVDYAGRVAIKTIEHL